MLYFYSNTAVKLSNTGDSTEDVDEATRLDKILIPDELFKTAKGLYIIPSASLI